MKLHVIVMMGVSGAGKTVVGSALAHALGWTFYDADDFHSAANIAKMHRGEGLTDANREPWLEALDALISHVVKADDRAVLACSALKHSYRERFRAAAIDREAVTFVFLDVPAAVLRERLADRSGHFAPVELLASQLETLEPPTEALCVDGTQTVAEIVEQIRTTLGV